MSSTRRQSDKAQAKPRSTPLSSFRRCFDSEAELDKYFSKKELVMSLEGGKLFVIVGGYQLKLPTNYNALIKYARLKGQTSARKRLPDHWRFSAPKLQDGKWIHDKNWGPSHELPFKTTEW